MYQSLELVPYQSQSFKGVGKMPKYIELSADEHISLEELFGNQQEEKGEEDANN